MILACVFWRSLFWTSAKTVFDNVHFFLRTSRLISERRLIMKPQFPSGYFPIHHFLSITRFDFNRCVSLNRQNGPLVSSYLSVFSPVSLRLPLDGFLWNLILRTYKNLPINSKYARNWTRLLDTLCEELNMFIFLTALLNICSSKTKQREQNFAFV